MKTLEKFLSKWHFKKIAVWYLVIALLAGLGCAGVVGFLYRERLNFAWQYSRLEEAKDASALQAAAEKTAGASADVVDILILDPSGQVTYSAKKSEFSAGPLDLTKAGAEKKYLVSAAYPDAVFQYVKSEEFMLRSIVNKDFGKIRADYEDDSAFESDLSAKTIYMLSRVSAFDGSKVYVISVPTSVPGGLTALKAAGALAVLFFCVYWVLVALWMYRNAAACGLSPLYWGLIGLFTNLVGLMVYLLCKRNMAVCGACGRAQRADHLFCSHCGAKIGRSCEICGSQVSPRDSFCHHCGGRLQ